MDTKYILVRTCKILSLDFLIQHGFWCLTLLKHFIILFVFKMYDPPMHIDSTFLLHIKEGYPNCFLVNEGWTYPSGNGETMNIVVDVSL